jgi:hypothetical protein
MPGAFIDYYPDVTVGRLPFEYSSEIKPVVDKIINYENTATDSWFKKAVTVGGDTSPPARGEVDLGRDLRDLRDPEETSDEDEPDDHRLGQAHKDALQSQS